MCTKKCKKCNLTKKISDFYKVKKCKDGHRNSCKECVKKRVSVYNKNNMEKRKKYSTEYYNKNKDIIKKRVKKYRVENSEKISLSKKKWEKENPNKVRTIKKRYRDSNLEKTRQYRKWKEKNDINYKLSQRLRGRLKVAIKGNYKSGSAVDDLGCSIKDLKKHLEHQFQEGMSWNNWAIDSWHIDHIKPLSSFDLSNREEFLKACHYTNLQPLWAKDNLKKSNNI